MNQHNIMNDLFEICSHTMNERFNAFSRMGQCEVLEIPAGEILDSIDYRSEVLLYGVSLTVRLQFFYNCEAVGLSLAHLYDDAGKNRVIDFFNEVGNLTGGKIKEVLMGEKIITALSLPMCIATRKDRCVMTEEVLPYSKYFNVNDKNKNIYSCKVSFEIHDLKKFVNFNKNALKSSVDSGEIDFF